MDQGYDQIAHRGPISDGCEGDIFVSYGTGRVGEGRGNSIYDINTCNILIDVFLVHNIADINIISTTPNTFSTGAKRC